MSKHPKYVVYSPSSELYLIGYNAEEPAKSLFGNPENAIIFDTLEEAEARAADIGGGTVGTTKP